MKTYLDCIPCFMQQTLRTGRLATTDEHVIKQLLDATGDMVKHLDMCQTPAEVGEVIYGNIRKITGVNDPYRQIKSNSITEAKALLPMLNDYLNQSEDRLLAAV